MHEQNVSFMTGISYCRHRHFLFSFNNFNEKITAECYRPNASANNFAHISFDLGPTLASWLEKAHPDVLRKIVASENDHWSRYKVSNALAQPYNHTILPLGNDRDRPTGYATRIKKSLKRGKKCATLKGKKNQRNS